ncbi:hypothetical protein [Paraflavitalea sp. CAU 1676]|uniref:hypothetical protein n=1 Tax=Paraflavitalea sp. CAU 1676 TaxID=3032598 RepID=UPI0023DA733D|nr:hypothetical protein [Paraflavitalea sp. CAU 1676]MDF2189289.1 hypothetical protein [Paraflavitalea sp. CAU 1676]
MKKSIAFLGAALLLSSMGFTASAQNSVAMPLVAGDTIANAGTVSKEFPVTGNYSLANAQVVITKINGTVAGTTKLQGTLNGTNWVDIGSAYTNTDVATQSTAFQITGGVTWSRLRVLSTGSGTMNAQVKVWYLLKPPLQ